MYSHNSVDGFLYIIYIVCFPSIVTVNYIWYMGYNVIFDMVYYIWEDWIYYS